MNDNVSRRFATRSALLNQSYQSIAAGLMANTNATIFCSRQVSKLLSEHAAVLRHFGQPGIHDDSPSRSAARTIDRFV